MFMQDLYASRMMELPYRGSKPAMNPFPDSCPDPVVALSGVHERTGMPPVRQTIGISMKDLARGVMIVGAARSGKTNVISEFVRMQIASLGEREKLIILDVKGEYYERFGKRTPNAKCIGVWKDQNRWNLFRDILAACGDESMDKITVYTQELTEYLFLNQKNDVNPFFPLAAKAITGCVIQWMIRHALESGDKSRLHNKALKEFLTSATVEDYAELFDEYEDFGSAKNYLISHDISLTQQGAGVLAEIDLMARRMFVGSFGGNGDFSIVEWLRSPDAGVLFLFSAPDTPEVVNPVLGCIVDTAIKALSDTSTQQPRRTFFMLDEFPQIRLKQLEQALGTLAYRNVSIVIGLQDLTQLMKHNQEEYEAESLQNLFQTVICLTASSKTVRYMQGRFGSVEVQMMYPTATGAMQSQIVTKNSVEDYEILQLQTGEAFVRLPDHSTFKFRFDDYSGR